MRLCIFLLVQADCNRYFISFYFISFMPLLIVVVPFVFYFIFGLVFLRVAVPLTVINYA